MSRRWLPVLVVALVSVGCGDDDASPDPAAFCTSLERLTENDPFAAFGDRATAAEIEVAFGALVQRADELVDLAPEEARPAASQYADAARALDDLLAGAAYDGTAVDTRAYREEQTNYVGAAERLERYLAAEC